MARHAKHIWIVEERTGGCRFGSWKRLLANFASQSAAENHIKWLKDQPFPSLYRVVKYTREEAKDAL